VTTTTTSPSRVALARALTNDRNGVVSAKDAKVIVEESVAEIKAAKDPQRAFERTTQTINAALALVSPTGAAQKTLKDFSTVGKNAVSVRLTELAGAGALPADVKAELKKLLSEADVIDHRATFRTDAVKGDAQKGFSFEFTAGSVTGKAYALRHNDRWFLSPVPLSKKNLDDATTAMRSWFETDFVPDMQQWGASAQEIREAREALLPRYAYFPGASDPYDLVSSYAVVLAFDNESGSDHGLFLGINFATGDHEAYAFN
jgi:hypothetical protein